MRRVRKDSRREFGAGDASHRPGGAQARATDRSNAEREQLLEKLAAARWSTAATPDWTHVTPEQFELVKRGDRRAIYRVDLPHGAVYVKHRWSRGFWGRLLYRLRGSATRREYLRTREAARRDVPTTECLSFGEAVDRTASADFLVTREMADAEPLDQFVLTKLPCLGAAARRLLIESLAALLAQAHEAGIEHDDLHAGNILIAWQDRSQRPDLRLIDLDRARVGRPLGWRASRRNLAMLLCGLHHVATPRDFWRFWRAYRRLRGMTVGVAQAAVSPSPRPSPWEGEGARGLAQRVEGKRKALEVWRRGMDRVWRVLRARDRRALRNNREFLALRRAAGFALAVRETPESILIELLGSPGKILAGPGTEALKLSFGSVVVKASQKSAGREIVYKRIRAKSVWKQLLAPFRASRARIGWHRGHALLARGIATARPHFVLEPRLASWRGESYLATEWIPGAENLHLWLWRVAKLPGNERRELIRHSAIELGAMLGKMHRYAIAHRDLKGCNLVAIEKDGVVNWLVLDLEGMRLRRRVSFAERASDLARLAVSAEIHPCLTRADRWRFLRAYAQAVGERDKIKRLWRAIAANCRRELARFARRGKSVA